MTADEEGDERRIRSSTLRDLALEDLERLSQEDLAVRIECLEAEKQRTNAALTAKSGLRGNADLLFKR